MVFESSDPNTRTIAATDKRFFWLSLYVAPTLWVGLAILAIIKLSSVIWLSLVGKLVAVRTGLWVLDAVLTYYSDCPGFDDYEHRCFLPLRSVQPGFDICY